MITEIEELSDQEAERLSDRLEEYVKDKRKRDFEILLLKGDIEKRKKYPLGVPPGPSPEYLQEQRKERQRRQGKTRNSNGSARRKKKTNLSWCT